MSAPALTSDLDLALMTQQPLSLDELATTSEAFRKLIEHDKVVVQAAALGYA